VCTCVRVGLGMGSVDVTKRPPPVSDRPEPWAWHLLGLVFPGIVITGNVLGGPATIAGVLWTLGMGPALDVLFGRAVRPRPPRASGLPFRMLLYLHAALQLGAVATLLWRVSSGGPDVWSWWAALSTGSNSGASGIIVAHELGHTRPRSLPWWAGRLNLLTVLYLHFTTEHNHTHHRHVATELDPASARLGESLWHFVARTVPGQFLDALAVERSRGRTGMENAVARGAVTQVIGLGFLLALLGPWVTAAFILQAAFAVFLLEYINYIRHYGLVRAVGERQTAAHSWQAEQRWSRWTLLELTRHPAHHLKASEPFWRLQPFDEAPELPSGYYGCFWLAVVPPLWRRVVHPRIPPQFLPD
jgi:alkane 1-monooxygenase